MCQLCNNSTNPDDADRHAANWTISIWHVVSEHETENSLEVGICGDGPHRMPDVASFPDPNKLVADFAEAMNEIGQTLAIDPRATTDAYLVGYVGRVRKNLFLPESFDRSAFFLVHQVTTDPEQLYKEINAIAALELSLGGKS